MGLGNRGAQAAPPAPRAPPPPPRLPGSLRSPPVGWDPNVRAQVQVPEGAQGVAAGSAGSLAPPPVLRGRGLVQPARFWAERGRGSSPGAGGYLTAVSLAARREAATPDSQLRRWRYGVDQSPGGRFPAPSAWCRPGGRCLLPAGPAAAK